MSADTDKAVMSKAEAKVIELINRASAARGDKEGETPEVVAILQALIPLMMSNGNGNTRNKVWWLVGAFGVCAVCASYLVPKVIAQGEDIVALKTEIQQCLKKSNP